MENLNIKYRISLAILSILLVVALFVGSSYALWSLTVYQQTVNKIETGCFDITFESLSSSISLQNTYPISDEAGFKTTPYKFRVSNNCTISADYKIYLNTLKITDGNKISDSLIKYSLYKTGDSLKTANMVNTLDVNSETLSFDYVENLDTSYILATGFLNEGESAEYSLYLWIDSSATTAINGYKFQAAVTSVAYAADTQ
jgi:hypothetical protein